jgi:hypothetical protein
MEVDGIEWNPDGSAGILEGRERLVENLGICRGGSAIEVAAVIQADAHDLGGLAGIEKLDGIQGMNGSGGCGGVEEIAAKFMDSIGFEKAISGAVIYGKTDEIKHGSD